MIGKEHTPGPWKIGPAQWRRGGPPYKIPISGPNGTIANVLTHDAIRREGWGTRPPEQPNADAVLIARAPELLADNARLQARVAELEKEQSLWKLRYRGAYETAENNANRVAELENTSTIDNAYIAKLEMLLQMARPYITVDCDLASQIDGVLSK